MRSGWHHPAYLVAFLCYNPKSGGQAVAHVGIFGESAEELTMEHGTTYADLASCDGASYQEAHDRVIELVRQYRHLHWTLPWIDETPGYRASPERAAFLRKVEESFRG